MFVNRKNELQFLEDSFNRKNSNFVIIYGRRRVGKTELIKQFMRNHSGFYFLADRLPERENLKTLTGILRNYYEDDFLADFDNWYTFFNYLKARMNQGTVAIIDEFPYLVDTNPALSSVFQKGWDEVLKDLPIFLILCGSSIGIMQRETLTYKSPLYGRRTGQLNIKPMNFFDFQDFFPELEFSRQLELFTISGGIPAYILQLSSRLSLQDNIIRNVLNPGCYLYQEVNFILREEVREPRIYFSILKAIALGKRKFGDIVNESGIQKTSLHKYLYILEDLNFIEKEFPITEKKFEKSRKGLYRITDPFFNFWFSFVFPYHSDLEIGNEKPSLRRVAQYFVHLAALCYEEVAKNIVKKYQKYLFEIFRIGRWWDKENEIDIVAYDESKENMLFCEVKWSTKLVGTNIYDALVRKSAFVEWPYKYAHYALVSRSGFTDDMIKLAEKKNILLIKGDKLV